MADPGGFLLVDKPSGPTSHDVVDAARKAVGIRRIGHAGTLDPMATGLLILGVGKATRLLRFLADEDKEYEAVARLGVLTDSFDVDGSVLSREPTYVTLSDLEVAAQRFRGRYLQTPPMVSAIRVNGRRLYDLARSGEEAEREPRPVTIHSLDLREVTPGPFPELSFRVVCSSGTYVRSLADDLAQAAGTRAHLAELRRTRIGSHSADTAIPLRELPERWERELLGLSAGLPHLPEVAVDDDTALGVSNGMVYPAAGLAPGVHGLFRVVDTGGRLLAVYRSDRSKAKPEVVTT